MTRYGIYNVLEVIVTVVCSIYLVPLAHSLAPDVPDFVWNIATPAFVAVIVAFVSLLAWQKAAITAVWKHQDGPELADIIERLHPVTGVSPFYEIAFSGQPRGGLTRLLLWWLKRNRLRLTFRVVGPPITTTVEISTRDADGVNLARPDYYNGFSARVIDDPNPYTWLFAVIYFDAGISMNQQKFKVEYGATADGRLANLLAKLVGVTSPTNTIVFH